MEISIFALKRAFIVPVYSSTLHPELTPLHPPRDTWVSNVYSQPLPHASVLQLPFRALPRRLSVVAVVFDF